MLLFVATNQSTRVWYLRKENYDPINISLVWDLQAHFFII